MSVFSSKREEFSLYKPNSRRNFQYIPVRLTLLQGRLHIKSIRRSLRASIASKLKFNRRSNTYQEHDLHVVWVTDIPDDPEGEIKDCFVIVTPEKNYILHSDSRRKKIDWMQSIAIEVSQCLRYRHSYRPHSWSNLDDLQQWLDIREVSYTFITHSDYSGAKYSGKWSLGMPHFKGKLKWPSGDHYDGEFLHGHFHGSGTRLWLEHQHQRSYTGSWQNGIMEGFGEMSYRDHSVYTGWWHLGLRQGHGRIVYHPSNSFYIGDWYNNKRHGYGVMASKDMKHAYLGMWKEDEYQGPGILLNKGKLCEGYFEHGERRALSEDMVHLGIIDINKKWNALFHTCSALLEQMGSVEHEIHQQDSFYEKSPSEDQKLHFVRSSRSVSQVSNCSVCSVEGFRTSYHPLGTLAINLIKAFELSYSSLNAKLLPHAVREVKYILDRTSQIIEQHCPHLNEVELISQPRSHLSLLLIPLGDPFCWQLRGLDWLHPILLSPIYSTLFALYQAANVHFDNKIVTVICDLQLYSCEEMCIMFLPEKEDSCCENKNNNLPTDDMIKDCIHIFQHLSNYHTPLNKLLCIRDVHTEIIKLVHSKRCLVHCIWCCAIVRAKIPSLFSEIQFMKDFAKSLVDDEFCAPFDALKEAYTELDSISKTCV